jgi:hypothetical protein
MGKDGVTPLPRTQIRHMTGTTHVQDAFGRAPDRHLLQMWDWHFDRRLQEMGSSWHGSNIGG